MSTIFDEAWNGKLTAATLKGYIAKDPSIIDRAGGKKKVTPLAAACWRGNLEAVEVLLAAGANPNALSPPSHTPLYFVTAQSPRGNRFEILRALIGPRVKADINMPCDKDGNTPLMNALSKSKDKQIVRELIDRKADVTIKNAKGETAVSLAEQNKMKPYMRTKAERNSATAQIVDLAVSAVLLTISYANSGFLKSAVRGVAKKFFNITGVAEPNSKIAKELPKPSTVKEFQENLNIYVRNGELGKFFAPDHPFLQKLAAKAFALHEDDTADPENIKGLYRLSLYRLVIFCDDSGSMEFDDRFLNQLALVNRIARVATQITPDDYKGVDLRFINSPDSDRLDGKALEQAIKAVKPKGGTPIGTNLRSKILEPLVYKAIDAGTFKRPLFVCVITDGSPTGEVPDVFTKAILECKDTLVGAGYNGACVKFLVSQIGDDEFATDFLESLKRERTEQKLEEVLHCTSDRLDDKFRELEKNERLMERWLIEMLTKPFMERHEE